MNHRSEQQSTLYCTRRACVRKIALAGITFLMACSATGGDDLFRVEVREGISHSIAADRPEWPDAVLGLLWEAPSYAEILDGGEWAHPTQLAADVRGVAVLDPQISRVHLFEPDGSRAGSLGRRGEGPGELSRPAGLAVHGDTIMVHDTRRSSLQLFRWTGDYIGGFANVEGMSFGFYHLGSAGVLRPYVQSSAGASGQRWELVGFDGERRTLAQPGNHPLQPHVQEGDEGCWRRGTGGSHLLEVDCTFPLIRVVSMAGEVVREHRIDLAPVATSAEELASMGDMMRQTMSDAPIAPAQIESMVTEWQERNRWMPRMRQVVGSPSGERLVLWEQISEDFGGGEGTLHLLDGDGRYLVRQPMGAPLQAVAITDERIYVLISDPGTDLRTLRAYRMP